jgi:hypothetical protein
MRVNGEHTHLIQHTHLSTPHSASKVLVLNLEIVKLERDAISLCAISIGTDKETTHRRHDSAHAYRIQSRHAVGKATIELAQRTTNTGAGNVTTRTRLRSPPKIKTITRAHNTQHSTRAPRAVVSVAQVARHVDAHRAQAVEQWQCDGHDLRDDVITCTCVHCDTLTCIRPSSPARAGRGRVTGESVAQRSSMSTICAHRAACEIAIKLHTHAART